MAAEEGNKYAEKWTKEAVLLKLKELKDAAPTCCYIGEGLATIGLYHQWYSAMAEKFKDDDDVSDTIKSIDQLFETKLVKDTLKGNVNATMAIFTLKNKHQWKDKQEVEQSGSLGLTWNETKTYHNRPNELT